MCFADLFDFSVNGLTGRDIDLVLDSMSALRRVGDNGFMIGTDDLLFKTGADDLWRRSLGAVSDFPHQYQEEEGLPGGRFCCIVSFNKSTGRGREKRTQDMIIGAAVSQEWKLN